MALTEGISLQRPGVRNLFPSSKGAGGQSAQLTDSEGNSKILGATSASSLRIFSSFF
jgi:hypothetical protein